MLIDAKNVGALLSLTAKTVLSNWRKLKLPAPIALGDSRNATKRWWLGDIQQYVDDLTCRRDVQQKVIARIAAEHRRRHKRVKAGQENGGERGDKSRQVTSR
ncbi:MAG TPA: hypothetical protein VJ464_17945 [Blastocatellia bacterium]|nr:hypothetical protein [Blastocatellia bacterium]